MYLPKLLSSENSDLDLFSNFKRKDCLPPLPDEVWKIEQGFVRNLTWNDLGQITTLGLWGPGDVVGLPLTKVRPYQIECLTSVTAKALPLSSHSQYWRDMLLNHLWQTQELFGIIHQMSGPNRLLEFLHWLGHRFGRTMPEGQLLVEPILTHQELSEILGISRVTVTRLLTQLENEGQLVRLEKSRKKLNGSEQRSYRNGGILLPKAYTFSSKLRLIADYSAETSV